MSALAKLSELERRYSGAIPADELRALHYPSYLHMQLEDHRGQVKFYRDMLLQNVKSSKEWLKRGQLNNSQSCAKDAWLYLRGWRHHRKVVGQIEEMIASRVAEEETQEDREDNSQQGVGA